MTRLEAAILSTLAYFDVFEYPLTAVEAWKWCYVQRPEASDQRSAASLGQVFDTLDRLRREGRVGSRHGFWFLPRRDALVETRMVRSTIAEAKFERAKRLVRILRFFPFVRTICVCNSLAYGNARRESDIDFFILTAPRRTWSARFFTTAFLKLLRLRPTRGKTRDRFCLSFFVATDAPSLDVFKRDSEDPYLVFWVSQLVPMYDEAAFEAFWRTNAWIRERLPNALAVAPTSRRKIRPAGGVKRGIEFLARLVPERFLRAIQEGILPSHLRELANRDTRVVITDSVLKFHDNDRREAYAKMFTERLTAMKV